MDPRELMALNEQMGTKSSDPDDKMPIDLSRVAPLYDAVLVTFEVPIEETQEDDKLAGSELLLAARPQKKQKKYLEATVVRTGIGNFNDKGEEIKHPVAPGDRVLIPRNGGMGMVSAKDGKLFKIIRLKEVIFIINKYPEEK